MLLLSFVHTDSVPEYASLVSSISSKPMFVVASQCHFNASWVSVGVTSVLRLQGIEQLQQVTDFLGLWFIKKYDILPITFYPSAQCQNLRKYLEFILIKVPNGKLLFEYWINNYSAESDINKNEVLEVLSNTKDAAVTMVKLLKLAVKPIWFDFNFSFITFLFSIIQVTCCLLLLWNIIK